jgi:octaheme c-type cytochrome (tetrathionate reductase family)
MRKLVQVIFLVLIPQLFIALAIYNIQNIPNYNNIEELKEQYSERKLTTKDHSQFAELQQDFASAHDITAACLTCHEERGHELLLSHHFTWEKEEYIPGRGVVYYGKRNALNNFCTGIAAGSEPTCNRCHAGYGYGDNNFDFTNPLNIDCLVCHDNSFNYRKRSGGAGYPEVGEHAPDYPLVFANLGTPRIQNCGVCHFHSAGGNNVKHGDLEIALIDCSKDIDVHMSPEGADLTCVDCHQTQNHVMKGRYYGLSSTNERRAQCMDCHTPFPHKDDLMNEHTIKVDCRTCHIPTYAKANATKMYWDWSTACDLKGGMPYFELDEDGNQLYFSDKGSFLWGRDLIPDYQWFNGTADHHFLTDEIKEVPVQINKLFGSYHDAESKIIPKKIHRGKQPYDIHYNRIVQAKLWDYEKGKGALWKDYDWQASISTAMDFLNIPYSGEYGFVETEMHLPVSHMVAPKEQVVTCKECHTRHNSRLAGLDDFYMPGRDRNKYADLGGTLLILFTLAGVLFHAAIRIVAHRRLKQKNVINES